MESKTSIISNSMIWFGAAVSIAEILAGTLVAPLGFKGGLAAIFLGHFIGCVFLFFAGLIGAKTEKSAMDTVKMSFGQKGALIFSILNILQLVGWTAVMIKSGASSASLVVGGKSTPVITFVICAFIIIWVLAGTKNLDKINIAIMSALFVLTICLSTIVFGGNGSSALGQGAISFGEAIELSVAMPLSWLPLISDYTRNARKPFAATFASSAIYFFTSCWMYIIGMGMAIYTGESEIAVIMTKAGFGIVGLLIIIFSTVTTTYLDVYSAGVSAESISGRINIKTAALIVCALGTIFALFIPISLYEEFLYFISSVFSPMIAVLIVNYYVLKNDFSGNMFCYRNLFVWLLGFVVYRLSMGFNTVLGYTLPVMLITGAFCLLINLIKRRYKNVKTNA